MQLFIGNKNYSTWSLRAWLLLEKFDVDYEEVKLGLETAQFYNTLKNISPTLKVPTLVDGNVTVWESLAILEYINETYLSGQALPENREQRARARALCAEMHSGFSALKNAMPMNIRAKRHVEVDAKVSKDIQRIEDIFTEQTQYDYQGGWLFGHWTIVDAMYAPVCMRFYTYGVTLNETASRYVEHVLACPVLSKWREQALLEHEVVECDEAGIERKE
ncbi:glutathione S-transferase family protein [Pseudoalteromonas luteoviolacea]|uniref:glutathione S-transferase family protein n=1 Tax=Pseudoalteromonas luteoviolacea TaxID=43657 RepID=UPI001B364242|nr:glutathione S-transferase family protein [Pseudoalteromonas luteoviolacea]MBQ4836455.1 glutathione S-transferase family protein [Pseudoalteromonas luteoviolacea]